MIGCEERSFNQWGMGDTVGDLSCIILTKGLLYFNSNELCSTFSVTNNCLCELYEYFRQRGNKIILPTGYAPAAGTRCN